MVLLLCPVLSVSDIGTFSPYNMAVRSVLLTASIYRLGNWDIER